MWNIVLICVGVLGACHAYSETKTGKGYASASSGTGAYAGGGTYGTGVPFPIPPFLGSAGIGNQLAQYVEDLHNQQLASKTPCNSKHVSASHKNSRAVAASSSRACGRGGPHRARVSGHPVGFSAPAALNSGMSMTSTTGAATAHASSALHPDELFQHQFQQQQSLFNHIQNQAGASGGYGGSGSYGGSSGTGGFGGGYGGSGGYGGGYGGSYGGGYGGSGGSGYGSSGGSGYPNYASSSAAFGPGGVHQTASISPANPAIPNVNTRFDSASSGGPGFVGVSTSSFSESSDVDGYKSNRRGAVTSVNDNGKVSTYYTHS